MQTFNKNELNSLEKTIVKPVTQIGIMLNRTISLISVIYECFTNGIKYVPIDVNWPDERIEKIISDGEIEAVVTTQEYQHRLSNIDTIIIEDNSVVKLESYNDKSEVAYTLYTSGSTGTPKGVEITKKALLNFIDGISEIIDFSQGKRIACFTTVSFDIFFLESIMALEKGLTVVLANDDEQRNPKLMANLIKENDVDMIQMTPSRMQLLLNHDKELSSLKNVKEIMIGGEPFPLNLLRTLQEKTTAKIYNMYGPTETTIWSTVSDLTNKYHIDIGRPIKNTEVYIVDENLYILPEGQAGEICIAGKGLAKGYVGRNDLTAEKFINLPQKPETRVYRTGDVGKYLPNGNLEYIGRTDNQIKIRGHRVELEEIETHLNQFAGIKQSIAIALETSEIDKVLQAFYTSDIDIDSKDIIQYLSSKLPSHMIPAIFKRVENFVQTANGKIDRKKVFECVEIKVDSDMAEDMNCDEMTVVQKKALEVIVSNLDAKLSGEILLDTDFASVGIDSITFIKIVVALEGEFDFEFDDEMLLITKFPTVRTMISYVESKVQC